MACHTRSVYFWNDKKSALAKWLYLPFQAYCRCQRLESTPLLTIRLCWVPSDNNVILGHGDDSVERNRIGLSLVFDVKPMCDRIVLLSSTRHSTTPHFLAINRKEWAGRECVSVCMCLRRSISVYVYLCAHKHTHMHHCKYHKVSSIRKFPSLMLIRICIQPKLIILPMVTKQGLHIKKPEVCIRQSSLMNLPFSLC